MDYSIITAKNILVILILSGFCYITLKNSFFIGNLLGFIDLPNKRKIHKKIVPNFGGLLFIICSIIIFLFLYLSNQLNIEVKDLIYINIALITMFFVGYYDDIKNISPGKRVFLFFFILFIVIYENNNLYLKEIYFKNFFNVEIYVPNLAILFTTFCLFLFYNSFNFSDGANGIALSSSIIYLIYLLIKINYVDIYILFNLIILILIFLHNIKNKIFIGNSGSSAISIFLGLIFIYFYNKKFNLYADQIVILFLLPGLDMVRVTIERLFYNKNPLLPDKTHFHHLLIKFVDKNKIWVPYSVTTLMPILFYELKFKSEYIILFSIILFLLLIYYLKKK